MMYFGYFLLLVALVALVIGLLQRSKGNKIVSAPFKKTGEIASNPAVADAKGMVSCEGAIAAQQPVMAPCSNQQCVYYSLKIEKQIEESKMTDRGMQTTRTWRNVSEQSQGSFFHVNDGSGPIGIDAREGLDVELKESYSGAPPGGQGLGILANLVASSLLGGSERIIQYRATEKILPANGNLFVMGKLAGGQITKADGMTGKLLLSTRGRDGLIGATKRNSIIGFAVGGACAVAGIVLAIFGGKPRDLACKKSFDDTVTSMDGKDGEACNAALKTKRDEYTWSVSKPGLYEVTVAQPSDAKLSAIPRIYVFNSDDEDIGNYSDEDKSSSSKAMLTKGKYKIRIDGVDGSDIEGGYRYLLSVKSLGGGKDDGTKKAAKGDDGDDKPSKKKGKKDDDGDDK